MKSIVNTHEIQKLRLLEEKVQKAKDTDAGKANLNLWFLLVEVRASLTVINDEIQSNRLPDYDDEYANPDYLMEVERDKEAGL